jgi:hypothetical protein
MKCPSFPNLLFYVLLALKAKKESLAVQQSARLQLWENQVGTLKFAITNRFFIGPPGDQGPGL